MNLELTLRGKKAGDCTREELLELVASISAARSGMWEVQETAEITRLKTELKIKDSIIDKFILRTNAELNL